MIDLRSDTVTKPCAAMRQAMTDAELGDDVYGEDPTVNRLEALAAKMLGTEAALFAPSGTQSNLLALLSHCERGDEYIVGQHAHTYRYEGGGAAVLGSIQPQPLEFEPDGSLDLAKVAQFIKPDDSHYARTRLLCLENTQGGKALSLDYLATAHDFAQSHGLSTHLDGARIFNAVVACGVRTAEVAGHFDSISVCLSKGLGAPIGSVLCGSRSLIRRAHRWRKMLGGGMRQAGCIAAAGIYALTHNVDRLAEDHANAALLSAGLAEFATLTVSAAQTNMVFVDLPGSADDLTAFLKDRDILIQGQGKIRLVTHLDVSRDDIATVVAAFHAYFS
jgi:threonine aldolase